MQKVEQVAQLPGVNDLFTLLTFLADKKEGVAYLKKLEDIRADLNQQLKDMGVGKDIAAARNQANTYEYEAKKALEAARKESGKLIADAKAEKAELTTLSDNLKKIARGNARDAAKMQKERAVLDNEKKAHAVQVTNDKQAAESTKATLDARAKMLASKVETLNAMKKAL